MSFNTKILRGYLWLLIVKKSYSYRPGTAAVHEIRHYQKSTAIDFPNSIWCEKLLKMSKTDLFFHSAAIGALQGAGEACLAGLF